MQPSWPEADQRRRRRSWSTARPTSSNLLSRRSHRREHGHRERARACRRHWRQGDLGHREPRFLDLHDEDHQSREGLAVHRQQLARLLSDRDSTKPGGALHYTFQTEPQEFQRSGSTAKGVLTPAHEALGHKPKSVRRVRPGRRRRAVSVLALRSWRSRRKATKTDLIKFLPDTKVFTPLLTRVKADNPDVVHIWYNGDIAMIAYPQAVQLNVAPSYFLFGVDPGVWQERGLKSAVPITLSCVPFAGARRRSRPRRTISTSISRWACRRACNRRSRSLLRLCRHVREGDAGGWHGRRHRRDRGRA